MNLLSALGKRGVQLNLLSKKIDIEDNLDSSKYFVIAELDTVFTAGRNPVAFNGSSFLKDKSEIQIECLDSGGNSLYFEQAKSNVAQFTDVSNFVISVHVYDETYNGPGKLIFVGTTKDGKSVRWIRNITIDKTLSNARKVRFYQEPKLEIRPLLYPVVDLGKAADYDSSLYKQATAECFLDVSVSSIYFNPSNATGSGYISAPTVKFTDPLGNGSGASATTAIDSEGHITSLVLNSGGTGYSYSQPPTITFIGACTTPATAALSVISYVKSSSIIDGGSGYTAGSSPTVTFTGGGGLRAAASAVVSNGSVSVINMTNNGYGYISVPDITIQTSKPTTASELNISVIFNSGFYAYAVNPTKDTNQFLVNKKRIDIDYRLVASNIIEADANSSLLQIGSFNSQMEGRDIELTITKIKLPLSHNEISVNLTETFKIKKVLDSRTVILSDPFYYQVGNNKFVSNIIEGSCQVSYNYIKYNTNPDSSLTMIPKSGSTAVNVKESYVEATYRNLKTFSGFVARHKLYRRSLFYPGEFEQISDEPLRSIELLTDQITFNRTYYSIGKFYHQFHINKYLYTSSNEITVTAKSAPLNSVYISCGTPGLADGSKYVIIKTDTIGGTNDNVYYPYDSTEFDQLSGSSYNSNFINLKKDSLHSLSVSNVIVEKETDCVDSKISFYFTSSISSITKEQSYDPDFGLKIGEISVSELKNIKYFDKTQTMYFTPVDDYFGTLKIVPYHCSVTLSDLSLKAYGDSGFSPEVLVIRVPCPLNVSNEAFEFKAELYDINSILIPTDLQSSETFDQNGVSLYATDELGQVLIVQNNKQDIISTTNTFTINGDLYLPNLSADCEIKDTDRFVKWDSTDGSLKRTNVIGIRYDDEYIILRTGSCAIYGGAPGEGRSVNVIFDGVNGGRQIYWIGASTKQIDISV